MLFFKALRQGLTSGPKQFAEDTERRKLWFADRSHYFPEMMLIGSFAYLEGELGSGWIKKYGGRYKRELFILRHIRNAVVHEAGDLKRLNAFPPKKVDARNGRPPDIAKAVRRFASDLRRGRVTNKDKTVVPTYINVSRQGVATLNDDAFRRLGVLVAVILRNSGRLPSRSP